MKPDWKDATQLPADAPPLPEGWELAGTLGDYAYKVFGITWAPDEEEWTDPQMWFGMKGNDNSESKRWFYARRIKSDEGQGAESTADTALPGLVIPSEVCDDLESVSVIAFTARAEGYRIEWDSAGLMGWKE